MTDRWSLPDSAVIGGSTYAIHADFRDILEIFSYFEDPELPEFLRWQVALALFYEGEIPRAHRREAMAYLSDFLRCGEPERGGPRLLDWQHDSSAILADINRVCGREIRGEKFVHWWTFLSWFHAIGEGQVSALVSIRSKLRRGKKLEGWERDLYRENKHRIDLPKRYSKEELAQREQLEKLLGEQQTDSNLSGSSLERCRGEQCSSAQ